jgi:hypothetical protein
MSIERSDIKYYKSATFNDTVSNGGRRSNTQITTGSSNQLFPVITSAERAAGSSKLRKIFAQIESNQELPLIDAKVYIENPTPADDLVVFHAGTQVDAQSALTGSERLYGCGQLNASVTAGATEIVVAVEDDTLVIFEDGDLIRISNKSNIDDVTAGTTEEFAVVSGAPVVGVGIVTLTLAAGLANDYSNSNSRVSSVYNPGTVETSFQDVLVSSASGAWDSVTNPLTLTSKSTIDQTWTLTVISATQVSVVGNTVGSLGNFSILSDIVPTNPAYSAPYFRLPVAGLSGSFAVNDTITFKTNPQSIPLWFKRIIPAGISSFTGNKFVFVVEGESE